MILKLKGHHINITAIQGCAPTVESLENDFYGRHKDVKSHHTNVDFNAKVGSIKISEVTGRYGLGWRNESERMSVKFWLEKGRNHTNPKDASTVEGTHQMKKEMP